MTCWKSILTLTAFVVQDITTFHLILPTYLAHDISLPTFLAHDNTPCKVDKGLPSSQGLCVLEFSTHANNE